MLAWHPTRNLENSLKDFLDAKIITDSVTDIKNVAIPVRVGRKESNDWTLPCITLYNETELDPRIFIGSNYRNKTYVIIIDIYATNTGERSDIANWLPDAINNGFRYYTYTPNGSDPENPTKVAGGLADVEFLTNGRVALGQNIDISDAHRHRITINTQISGT